ncbi:YggS family pyridoxal phosphate-dependent enzyme [Arthrobacter sp. 35W]|uniref:YggS family pyridoxal phosphate-dependent enzyme n=1 Tax=Arthrobacter sp. 35W TaxID=1132441 RepID=UPI00041A9E26|nr:YggS family pyridoxal phosphate-dependent enzyme [Arthrobacter sp. 35W]
MLPVESTEAEPARTRAEALAANLAAVHARIDAAAQAPRAPGISVVAPQLIVVTKFHPAVDVRTLHGLGVRDVGENRCQEASAKAAELADAAPALRWHFIGQLQTNKAKSVAAYAHAVHSVDRPALVSALSRAVVAEQEATGRAELGVFLQMSLEDAAPQASGAAPAGAARGGADPAALLELAGLVEAAQGLRLRGLMAVAPLGADPDAAFERLAELSATLVAAFPGAGELSAGMSGDLEAAVRWGATHLRVGSDVLGPRPTVR